MKGATRSAGAVLIGALLAGTAGAQGINYTTQGFFSGPATSLPTVTCTTTASLVASCTNAALSLVFTGTSGINLANNTITSLGTFALSGTGDITVPPGNIFFTLLVHQTTPTTGSGNFNGELTGQVSTLDGNFSSLVWKPNGTQTIGSVGYQLVFDNIGPGAGGIGLPINHMRGVDALVTVTSTPEPGTIALTATGMAGLFGVIRRRRKNTAA
jgi:hypothetical protein